MVPVFAAKALNHYVDFDHTSPHLGSQFTTEAHRGHKLRQSRHHN